MLKLRFLHRLGMLGIALLLINATALANTLTNSLAPTPQTVTGIAIQPIPVHIVASSLDKKVYSVGGLCWLGDSDPAKKPTGAVQIMDTIDNNSSHIDMPNACPYDAAITPDGNTLYVASQQKVNNTPYFFTVSALDTHKKTFSPPIYHSTTRPEALALSEDGKKLFIATADNTILVVDTINNNIIDAFRTPAGSLNTMMINPKAEQLYAVYNRDAIYSFSTHMPYTAKSLLKIGTLRYKATLAMSQDGNILYAAIPQAKDNALGTTIYSIDVTNEQPVGKVRYESKDMLILSPSLVTDNNLLYFLNTKIKEMFVFDVAKGQVVKHAVAADSEAFAADMTTLPTATGSTAYITSFDWGPARAMLSKILL
jgi:DNA-binding beta-propeller fold protein YncE